MNEFDLIDQFFKPISAKRNDVLLGIGDDAACLKIPSGKNILVSTDTLVSGVHFLPEWTPFDIAYRSAVVNISDMAAMAAEPCWATLAITLPELNQPWLESFSQGFNAALSEYNVALIGGDTTRGPLSITITIMGTASEGRAVRRSGAKPGDIILVSGVLGAAALAVQFLAMDDLPPQDKDELMAKLLRPKPRIDLTPILRSYASSAIDISDGLSADLNHICVSSGVGACLTKNLIPTHALLNKYLAEQGVDLALTGGDDYELCFTVSSGSLDSLMKTLHKENLVCYPIGVIEEQNGLRLKLGDNTYEQLMPRGYAHF
ncbi:thiamine-phosphate kinase [Legionella fallonii]|uniref:Thiamine-monophosphate kinase n=1 Tax=Legionella fallonii LLAP-10 TaxID=1212491 RepID=A0A098G4V1_9GAMM|nr:thiamine-phosphate kinase [Legionella fallonii]CEG57492.1 thiamin-monophosphate kinase [Legionella fallonii LLAP-10]